MILEISSAPSGMTTRSAGWPRFSASAPYATREVSSVRTCAAPTIDRSCSTSSGGSGTSARARRQELQDALRAALELLHGGGVGNAEEARCVERLAGRQRHVRIVEQRRRELRRGAEAV